MMLRNGALAAAFCFGMAGCASSGVGEKPGAAAGDNTPQAEQVRKLAADIESQGDYGTAAAIYLRALDLTPGDPEILSRLGDIYMRQKRHAEAEMVYRKAAEGRPKDAKAWIGLSRAQLAVGNTAQGLVSMSRAASLAKTASEHNRLAVALTQAGRFSEAIASYTRAMALSPNDLDIQANAAIVTALAGGHDEAIGIMRRLAALPSAGGRQHANLLLVLVVAGRESEASAATPPGMSKNDAQAIIRAGRSIRNAKDDAAKGQALSVIFTG